MLYPEKAAFIEAAGTESSSSPFTKDVNPLDTQNKNADNNYPRQVITKQTQSYIAPAGTSWVNAGKSGSQATDPMREELDVVALWVDDDTAVKRSRIKLNEAGKAVKKLVRHEETGEIQFDSDGFDIVQTPFGPIHQPKLKPKTEDVREDYIEKKYKFRRHIVFIPKDDIILHDVNWTLPIPLVSQRDNFALDGYWSTGLALRLVKLTKARNLIWTMMLQKTKFSMSGTFLRNQHVAA